MGLEAKKGPKKEDFLEWPKLGVHHMTNEND